MTKLIRVVFAWFFPPDDFPLQKLRKQLGTEYEEPKSHWRMVE